jgi:hypothetical protein
LARLTTFAEDLRRRPGLPVSQTLRQEVYQLLLRFTTVRACIVADVVDISGVWDLHPEFAIIGRIYTSVQDQLATHSIFHTEKITARRLSCASLEPSFAVSGGVRRRWPRIRSTTPRRRPSGRARRRLFLQMRWVQTSQVAPASLPAPPIACASTWSTLPPAYSLAQQLQDTLASKICNGQPTFDVMARQTAAGFRKAGPLLGGLAGGCAEGIKLL